MKKDQFASRRRRSGEIEEAHDMIVGVILGEVEGLKLSEEQKALACAQADVLCWVLGHSHNVSFQNNLTNLKKAIRLMEKATGVKYTLEHRELPPST